MNPEEKQAVLGCVILALGFALLDNFAILSGVLVRYGQALVVVGGVILADYVIERILLAWRTKPR